MFIGHFHFVSYVGIHQSIYLESCKYVYLLIFRLYYFFSRRLIFCLTCDTKDGNCLKIEITILKMICEINIVNIVSRLRNSHKRNNKYSRKNIVPVLHPPCIDLFHFIPFFLFNFKAYPR